jgi:MFS family permease
VFGIGATLGPWLGGALVQVFGWPAVFWFRVPIAAAALVLLHDLPRGQRSGQPERFDLPGAGLLAVALVAMLLAVGRIDQLVALPLGLTSLAALVGFVWHERRVATPILDLGVFRVPGFALLNLANVLTSLAGFAVWLLVPFHLARASDLTLTQSGAILATASVGAVVASPLGGRLIGRVRANVLVVAAAVIAGTGLAFVGTWDRDTAALWLVAALTIQGFGLGLFQLAYTDIVTASIPRQNRGVAGSLAILTRTIGTVGAASLVMLVFARLGGGDEFDPAFRHTFWLAAALAFAMAALLALRGR